MAGVWGRGKRKSAVVRTGSPWRIAKLDALATYLRGYTVAGLHVPGKKACVEAFVGAGYRERQREDGSPASADLLMPDLAAEEPQAFLQAIARMALETNPAFHAYVFIDRSDARHEAVAKLQDDFAGIVLKNAVRSGGATEELGKLLALDWKERRAVMFVDPFGMQVEWETIEAIAHTAAIDLWILYPLAFGTARIAHHPNDVPSSWREHLNRFLGTAAWYDEFVAAESEPSLFRDEQATVNAKAAVLGRYFGSRLRSIFPVVAEQATVLRGPERQPLYLCSFALGPSAEVPNATRSANKLLERLTV